MVSVSSKGDYFVCQTTEISSAGASMFKDLFIEPLDIENIYFQKQVIYIINVDLQYTSYL